MKILEFALILSVGMASAMSVGCPGVSSDAPLPCDDGDDGDERCPADRRAAARCVDGEWEIFEVCNEGEWCEVVDGDAMCVPGSGGTGGSGGTAGSGGMGGTAGMAGSGGTAGSGGMAGTGGTGGGSGSCLEVDISGLPQIAGTLSISPPNATYDQLMTVTVDVDPDTMEVTAFILNEDSGVPGGSGFALTSGNETVEVGVRVETVAQPGPHVLELVLREDPLNRPNYVLYTPGDGDTYVRIEFENDVPGTEADTMCLVVNANVEF